MWVRAGPSKPLHWLIEFKMGQFLPQTVMRLWGSVGYRITQNFGVRGAIWGHNCRQNPLGGLVFKSQCPPWMWGLDP